MPDDKFQTPTRKAAPVAQRRAPLAFFALPWLSYFLINSSFLLPLLDLQTPIIMVSLRLPSFLQPLLLVTLLPLAVHGCEL